MKTRINLIISILVMLSMLLSACGSETTPTEAQQESVVVAEPTDAPNEPVETPELLGEPSAIEADKDGAFSELLAEMEAYNTIRADALLEAMVEDVPPFLLDVRTTGERKMAVISKELYMFRCANWAGTSISCLISTRQLWSIAAADGERQSR